MSSTPTTPNPVSPDPMSPSPASPGPDAGSTTPVPQQTLLALTVPEAEPAVGVHRARHDASAAVGLPAHVTLAYPFKPMHLLDGRDLATLQGLCARHPRFELRLASMGRFGDDVLFLAPEDAEPLTALMLDIGAAFPEYPLHGGAFPQPHPHLTVATTHGHPDLAAIERRVVRHLPVTHSARRVELWTGPVFGTGVPGWSMVEAFSLGT